jgi:hypothetical protein
MRRASPIAGQVKSNHTKTGHSDFGDQHSGSSLAQVEVVGGESNQLWQVHPPDERRPSFLFIR